MSIIATAQARLKTLTNQSIPPAGGLHWLRSGVNDEDGDIDVALNDTPQPAWPEHLEHGKVGYGLGGYGSGYGIQGEGFGYGSPYGSEYGVGGRCLDFVSAALADGSYAFACHPVDEAGNEDENPIETDTLTMAGTPEPPTKPAAVAADASNITLSWTLSTDDEG